MHIKSAFSTARERIIRVAERLILPAGIVGVGLLERAVTPQGTSGANLPLWAVAGFASAAELLRSYHAVELGVETNEKYARNLQLNAEQARLLGDQLVAAVGVTIGDLFRLESKTAATEDARESILGIAAQIESNFAAATAIHVTTFSAFSEPSLTAVVEAAALGSYLPWGDIDMWRSIVSGLAIEIGIMLDDVVMLSIAERCRNEFVRQFFRTIAADSSRDGTAFAVIHMRMLAQLAVTVKQAASQRHMDLDRILELIERQGSQLVDNYTAKKGSGGARRLKPFIVAVISIDSRLQRLGGKLDQVLEAVDDVNDNQKAIGDDIKNSVANSTITTQIEAAGVRDVVVTSGDTTRRWIMRTAVSIAVVVLSSALLAVIMVNRSNRHHATRVEQILIESRASTIDDRVASGSPFTAADREVAEKASRHSEPLTRARAHIINGNYEQARTILKASDKLVTDRFGYYTAMGDAYYFEGNYDRSVVPYEFAMAVPGYDDDSTAMLNLASALRQCRFEDFPNSIDRAVSLSNAAVNLSPRGSFEWARAQSELASAWNSLPTGDIDDNKRMAIAAYGHALTVFTKDRFPELYGITQRNLGTAWRSRPKGNKAENIAEALKAHRSAIDVRSRSDFPVQWAESQVDLSVAIRDDPTGDKKQNIEQAITACRLAIEELTHQDQPQLLSMAQGNLAMALLDRIDGKPEDDIEEAIRMDIAALKILSIERYPFMWAAIQNNLGNAYIRRKLGKPHENVALAISAREASLRVFTRMRYPEQWAVANYNLGNLWKDSPLDTVIVSGVPNQEKERNLKRAIAHYTAALEVFTEDRFPDNWAACCLNMGTCWAMKYEGDRNENLDNATKATVASQRVFTKDKNPVYWAIACFNLGNIWSDRLLDDKQESQSKAIGYYEQSLTVLIPEKYPVQHKMVQDALEMARQRLERLKDK